jgi:hypothetical protein
MIYTMERGVQKTTPEQFWRWLEYGVVALGSTLLLIFLGNVWYAANYNPPAGGTTVSQPGGKPISVAPASSTQQIVASDPNGAAPAAVALPTVSAASHTSDRSLVANSMTSPADSGQAAQPASGGDTVPVGDSTGGVVIPVPTDPVVVGTDPTGSDTPPASGGSGTDDGGNGGSGTTGGSTPPLLEVNLPIADVTIGSL